MHRINGNRQKGHIYEISVSSLVAILYLVTTLRGSNSDRALYISLALLVFWLAIAFFSQPNVFLKLLKTPQVMVFIAYILFYTITAIPKAGLMYTAKLIGLSLIVFSPMFIYMFYDKLNIKKLKTMLSIVIIYYFYLVFKAIVFYSSNPNAARRLASNEIAYGELAIGGGYALAYSAAILAVFLFESIANRRYKSKKKLFLFLTAVASLSILVFKTKSTLTIIWLIIGLLLSIVLADKQKLKSDRSDLLLYTMKVIMVVTAGLLLLLLHDNIGMLFLNLTADNYDVVSLRIKDIGNALIYGIDNSGQLALRLEIPMKSIRSFLYNPIIGRGYEYGYKALERYNYIGGHGEWADVLGNFGIMGSIPYFFTYYFIFKSNFKTSFKKRIPAYAIIFIMLGVFNPVVTFQSLLVLFLIIPSIKKVFGENMQTK